MSHSSPKQNWFDFLNENIPDRLPGEKVHTEMAPMRQLSSEALRVAKVIKESAVALHVFEKNDDLQIILTRRNTYEGAHSGQVSFPGGKMDKSDQDLIQTARRESFEEIGINVSEGKLIGKMTEIYIPVSQFKVSPFVFFHDQPLNELIPDPREVETIFYLPSETLVNDKNIQLLDIRISNDFVLEKVPSFVYQDFIIWGATAIILNEFKHVIKANY